LLRSLPLSPNPFLLDPTDQLDFTIKWEDVQEPEVLVREGGWGELPWSIEAGSISVTSTKGVGTGQSDDLLVVEAHSVENDSKMVLGLNCQRKQHFLLQIGSGLLVKRQAIYRPGWTHDARSHRFVLVAKGSVDQTNI